MRKIILILTLILVSTLTFSVSDEAKNYYLAGLRAYQLQDCSNAIKWFEQALIMDPSIEEYDPHVKFRIGYCAYILGDYERARDYLSLYPDNPVAANLLKSMDKVKESDEWKKWLDVPGESEVIPATVTEEATNVKSRNFYVSFKVYLLLLGLFLIVYSLIFFLELKTAFITRFVMKLMGRTATSELVKVKQLATEISEEAQETSEKEVELDIEEILDAPLDTVDRLIYGDSLGVKLEEEKEVIKDSESQKLKEYEEKKLQKENELQKELMGGKEEKTEKDTIIRELYHSEEEKEALTEENENEIMKKAEEMLRELEEEKEGIPVELAGRDVEELIEELEEKDTYDLKDAKAFVYILDNLINSQTIKEEAEEEANN